MGKDHDEGPEKHSKVTVSETVTKETGGTKTETEGGSDQSDGGTHHTFKKTTSKGDK